MPTEEKSPAVIEPSSGHVRELPDGYPELLEDIKARVRVAQVKASLSVNRELIALYWGIGQDILYRQSREGWGAKVVDRLSADLQKSFPGMQGFSPRNLKYMRAFAEAYPDGKFVQETLAQITWYHNITLLDKVKNVEERKWYVGQAVEHGWSRNVLVHQIESELYQRQGKAITNFKQTLPATQSDLAQQIIKDPYTFDFLTIAADTQESELEKNLIDHLQRFLLELGVGFAFVGKRVHLEVGKEDFYLDLLFYQLKLRCYVVIALKAGEFKPEYAGKMNFYLSAVDDRLRHKEDRPSIGIILCKSKDKLIAEYALRDAHKPIGVSAYKLTKALPEKLKGTLPTIQEIEKELGQGE